jgi:hypothetical protein
MHETNMGVDRYSVMLETNMGVDRYSAMHETSMGVGRYSAMHETSNSITNGLYAPAELSDQSCREEAVIQSFLSGSANYC